MEPKERCEWVGTDPYLVADHDTVWGVPLHEDQGLFEMLTLEGAQAGLSWITILRKKAAYRLAFDGFDPVVVAGYDPARIEALMADPGIVRNRRKIESAVLNARAFLEIRAEYGSFDRYIWSFVGGKPIQNAFRSLGELPARTPESEAMSRDLVRRGFHFVGPTICYAFMQAAGMVNDHVVGCFRYEQVKKLI